MSRRRLQTRLVTVLAIAGLLVLALLGRFTAAAALLLGLVVFLVGRSIFGAYSITRGPTGPPQDVDEPGTILVFACEVCGEQLVLLRKGTDAPPRHCSEKMVLRRVPVPEGYPNNN